MRILPFAPLTEAVLSRSLPCRWITWSLLCSLSMDLLATCDTLDHSLLYTFFSASFTRPSSGVPPTSLTALLRLTVFFSPYMILSSLVVFKPYKMLVSSKSCLQTWLLHWAPDFHINCLFNVTWIPGNSNDMGFLFSEMPNLFLP